MSSKKFITLVDEFFIKISKNHKNNDNHSKWIYWTLQNKKNTYVNFKSESEIFIHKMYQFHLINFIKPKK